MSRICVKQVWFEQVEPSTFSEQEFEDRVVLHAPSIYPEYYVIPFKCTVESEYGNAKPDLAFISRDYLEWRVVEVEMGYHNFNGHVEPQIQKLASANYDERVANYLCQKAPMLDKQLIYKLVTTEQPKILLIINEVKLDWQKKLTRYGAITATFELFKSNDDLEIFRVDGEYPTRLVATISKCTFHPFTPRVIQVHNPNPLNLPIGQQIRLRFNNCVTDWRRVDEQGIVWLIPVGRNPLDPAYQYEILRQGNDALVLRRSYI